MAGDSNVGSAAVYEAQDQRTSPAGENQPERFEEGQSKNDAHRSDDAKDERSIANRLEKETNKDDDEDKSTHSDLKPEAIEHGNKPSKGAIIDQQIALEEQAILAKKGSFGPKGS